MVCVWPSIPRHWTGARPDNNQNISNTSAVLQDKGMGGECSGTQDPRQDNICNICNKGISHFQV